MKLRSLFASILASVALIGCVQEEFPALSNIEVTPSYFTLGVDGGTKEVKVTSAAAWEITDTLPSWLSVSTLKGNGSKDGEAVTVTVAASTDTLARTAYLKFTSGKETQLVTVNQDAFMPDFPEFKGGEYWIMTADRKSVVFPIDDGGNGYGYMNVVATIEGNSTAENIYTFTPVEGEAGGFTIVDTKGRYHIGSTYNSFTVSATNPADGSEVWYVKQVSATGHQIVNKKNTWAIVMSTYGNFCPYPEGHDKSTGELPFLVKVEEVAEEAPLGESMKINEALEYKPELIVEGLVTASSTKGVIVTDKTGSLLVYGINSEVKVGDALKVKGNLSSYNKGYQLANPHQYEIASSDNAIEYPEATELTTTSIPELVKPAIFLAQYVSVKGIVATDNYNNAIVTVGDYKVKSYYSHDSYADFSEKAAEVKGYLVAYKESAKELSLIVTSIEEIEGWEPEQPVEPEKPEVTSLTLTNAEICAAMTSSETSYVEYTIESASGVWTVNASQNEANTFLQCRGRKGSYIKTPAFDKDIKSVTIHFSEAKSAYANNTYCAFPATWTAPAEDAAYPEDGNVGKAVTDGSYSLTIPVNAGNKQVCISITGGTYTYYLDHIDVEF